ncbi:N-acyl amino acid synthase FeeM domain-containing protein [Piscinibacter koreensis]|nr:hypothetical protein [Schlegelella koreensis]
MSLRSMLLEDVAQLSTSDAEVDGRLITIRAADTEGHRSSAHILLNRMYAGRGYSSVAMPDAEDGNRLTLIGQDHDVTLGTITIGFDGSGGLLADECFHDCVSTLRSEGLVLCEFVKLAIDDNTHSKRVLASLFHTAFIYAHEIRGCDRIVIEVNPRHVRFYRTMLGFSVLAGERLNCRVNAPAVLLALDLADAAARIGHVNATKNSHAAAERSMYRYAFSSDELSGIVSRLKRRDER